MRLRLTNQWIADLGQAGVLDDAHGTAFGLLERPYDDRIDTGWCSHSGQPRGLPVLCAFARPISIIDAHAALAAQYDFDRVFVTVALKSVARLEMEAER